MKRHLGGTRVKRGFYLNLATGELVRSAAYKDILPGTSKTRYIWVPGLLVFPIALLMGAAYVVFLPLAGILGTLLHLVGLLTRFVIRSAR